MRLLGIQQTKGLYIAFILSTIVLITNAQVLPSASDMSYLYAPNASIHLRHQLVSSNDKVWLVLEVNAQKTVSDSLVFGFAFTPNLDKPIDTFTEIDLSNYQIFKYDEQHTYAVDVTNAKYRYVVFRILKRSTSDNYTYVVELSNPANAIFSSTQLTLPNLKGFASEGSNVKVSTLYTSDIEYGVSFYNRSFAPSLPPMADIKIENPLEHPDTSYMIKSGDYLKTDIPGLYTIFSEENEKKISFFRIEDKNYPKIVTINKLIESSIYLFTREERNKLSEASDPKKMYDTFWLNNTNSAERAGNTIAAYFNRIREANEKFTSYKEGWKTDMGMIYIIFGPPDKVFRTNDGMQWVYKKTYELPGITFTFFLNSELITSEYYELERGPQYQTVWFRAIELWRKGRKSL